MKPKKGEADFDLLRFELLVSPFAGSYLVHYSLRLPPLSSGMGLLAYLVIAIPWVWLYWRARPLGKVAYWSSYSVLPVVLTVLMGYMAFRFLPAAVSIPASDQQTREPLFLHMSDLHFLAAGRSRSAEGKSIDAGQAARLVEFVNAVRPRYLIISGDVTDAGAQDEWRHALEELLNPLRSAGIKIIMAPGNHDVQPALLLYRGAPPVEDKRWTPVVVEAQVAARFLRSLSGFDPVLQNPAGLDLDSLLMPWTGNTLTFKLPQEEYRKCFENRAATVAIPGRSLTGPAMIADASCKEELNRDILDFIRAYRSWFPLVLPDSSARTTFVVLNSNNDAVEAIGSNAVGTLGSEQLDRLHNILASLPGSTRQCVVIMHHMPVRRAEDTFGLPRGPTYESLTEALAFQYSAMSTRVRDVRRLVKLIGEATTNRPDLTVFLLCGHFHRRWLGQISPQLKIEEAGPPLETGGAWVGAWDPGGEHLVTSWRELQIR